MAELNEKAVWEALRADRAFVAFDWIADATGFDFAAVGPSRRCEMGSRLACEAGLKLHAQAALPVHWKLLRNGKLARQCEGRSLDVPVTEPGNYRVEAWLKVAGKELIWILSNPLYIRPASGSADPKPPS
jgi:hypothetical protein